MAYATSNPPICQIPRVGSGPAVWVYKSADIHTDVDASDYFSDGDALGLKVGDAMCVIDTTNSNVTWHYVSVVTSGGAATIAADVTA